MNDEDAEMTARFLMGVIIGVLVCLLLLNAYGCQQVTVQVGDSNDSTKGTIVVKPKGLDK